ncbi:interleukin-6-like [Aulostomus maculatus]
MTPRLYVYFLSALMLAAVALRAPAAPVTEAFSENPAGDPSGEEDAEASPVWDSLLSTTARHRKDFENEFLDVNYNFLEHYKISSLPPNCPISNFSMEASLHRLVHGLFVYQALLNYVESECPKSRIPSEARHYIRLLIVELKEKMRKPQEVKTLNGSQEEQLLKPLNLLPSFPGKMTAHSILQQLHIFLVDCKHAIDRREMLRGRLPKDNVVPISVSPSAFQR